MKIITGTAKGKKLITLEGEATRPTSERIKEAVFSSIQFDIENRTVLDLFGGCGQLGLEALSRGAASCMFVDASADAVSVIKKNAETTGFFGKSRFLVSDYRNYIRKAAGDYRFDLVFIDPPYALCCCLDALSRLVQSGMLAKGALVVLESGTEDTDLSKTPLKPLFEVRKSTRYGKKTGIDILFFKGGDPA